MKTLKTNYVVSVNDNNSMHTKFDVALCRYDEIDFFFSEEHLAHQVIKVWEKNTVNLLDTQVNIKPLPQFTISYDGSDEEEIEEEEFELTITKKQRRSKKLDFCLWNETAHEVIRWQEDIPQ